MGLYTVKETREIVRTALVDAEDAGQAARYFNNLRVYSGRVDIQSQSDERHIVVKEYVEEEDK